MQTDRSAAPSSSWGLGVGIGALYLGGVAPSGAPGGQWFLEARTLRASFPLTFRLSLLTTITQARSTDQGEAKLRLTAARLEGCSPAFAPAKSFTVGPCLYAEAGSLHAWGEQIQTPRDVTITWAALGAGARAEYSASSLFLGLQGGVSFPLRHDSFYFRPDRTVHTIPDAAASVGLDFGARFP